MPSLAKHQLEELTAIIRQHYVKTYRHRNTPKYGHLNKAFDDWQLQGFFRVIGNPKYRLLFSYMAYLGFRIGEVIRINLNEIDFRTREMKFRSEKSGRLDSLIIPTQLFEETIGYIKANKRQIEGCEGLHILPG